MKMAPPLFSFYSAVRWQLSAGVVIAVTAILFFFHTRNAASGMDGLWSVSVRECLVECNLPSVTSSVTDICIAGGRVALRVNNRNYEGSITFDKDQFHASLDPVYLGAKLQRVYAPNARVGLDGRFQMAGDNLILNIDEIGDVLDTRASRGSAPATWRLHLERKSVACDLQHFIMRHIPEEWPPQ